MRLIDADALVADTQFFDGDEWHYGYTEDEIKEAPTIDAVPVRHGDWLPGIELSREYVGNVCVSIDFEDWRCSICGIVVEQPNMPLYKYCPNCGAKMDRGEAEP